MLQIDWLAFVKVLIAAIIGGGLLVFFYGLGLRLLVDGGKPPVVHPAEYPDAITTLSPKQMRKAEKKAAKVAKRNPLSAGARRAVLACAYGCFTLCALTILGAVVLIVVH